MIQSISPHELEDLHRNEQPIELIDVRTPAEFQALRVAFARNVPLGQLNADVFRRGGSNEPLYIICQRGARGQKACEALAQAGIENVFNVEGGTAACEATTLPLVRGKKAISLERQVRIAAGSFVLLGIALALAVDPWFVALSAFIGAGLVFSGVTDTCGMGMILARMPWNQSCSTGTARGQ